jgi:hypothetical protein
MEVESGPEPTLIVEFPIEAGMRQIARSPAELAQKSADALDGAMGTISGMSTRLKQTIERMPDRPSQLEVEFGIKLTAEAGAIISKIGGEAALNVRFTWQGG